MRKNGVFTGAVLDGLQCRARHDRSGMVTIDTLSATVERSVLAWIRTNRDPAIRNATQVNIDGAARKIPLAICSHPPPSDPPPAPDDALPSPLPRPASRIPLRPLLEDCRKDGETLMALYDSQQPDRFVTAYLRWRDGCVAVLRDLDDQLPQRESQENETTRFLSVANFWCATKCPNTAANAAAFSACTP